MLKIWLAVWGIIYLVGLAASHFLLQGGSSEAALWWVWLILFAISWVTLGRSMKKQTSKQMQGVWTLSLVVAILFTLAYLGGILRFEGGAIMAVWFLLQAGPLIAGGLENKHSPQVTHGLILLAFGLVLPLWYATSYFLVGAVLLGLPLLAGGLMTKK